MSVNNQRSRGIVRVAELLTHIDDPDWVIVDCRFNLLQPAAGRDAWESGHIPGAVYANLDKDLAAAVAPDGAGGRHPLPDPERFAEMASAWGVHSNSTVIVYDDVGNAIAARLWWLLRWFGHERVAVLDGGLHSWITAGEQLVTESSVRACGSFVPKPGSLPVIAAAQVQAALDRNELVLLDARAPDRFSGRNEPIDRLGGHVPGAVNAPFQDNLDADKCFRPTSELQAYYRALIADRPIDTVACMCGSGVTACHTLLALEAAGMPGAALYVGSWSDWISAEDRPIAEN